MADEVKSGEAAAAVVTPTGTEKPASKVPAALDLDAKVTVGGKEWTVKELTDRAQEADKLAEYRRHTATLVKGGAEGGEKETAMRYILAAEGYEPEQINQYIADVRGEGAEAEPGDVGVTNQGANDELGALRQEMAALREQTKQQKYNALAREMASQMDRALTGDKDLATLMSKIKDLKGSEGLGEAEETIKAEIQARTVKLLQSRMALTGLSVDEQWVKDELPKAAKATYKSYLSVIGDPNKIMRAPETATGLDILKSRAPVPAPKFERGDKMGTVQNKSRDWANDMLVRLALETGGAGESRV